MIPKTEVVRHVFYMPRRDVLTALVVLVAMLHISVFVIFHFDRLVSPLPYRKGAEQVRDFIHSPILPLVHLVAALLLILGIILYRLRPTVTLVSFAVFGAHAVVLIYSAQSHLPPGSLLGVVLMFFATGISSILVAAWGNEIAEVA